MRRVARSCVEGDRGVPGVSIIRTVAAGDSQCDDDREGKGEVDCRGVAKVER